MANLESRVEGDNESSAVSGRMQKSLRLIHAESDLYRPLEFKSIEDFKDRQGNPVYSAHDLRAIANYFSTHIFQYAGKWTVAQMIDFCTSGKPTTKKARFIKIIEQSGTSEARFYLESRVGEGELHKLRNLREALDFAGADNKPIFSPYSIRKLKQTHPDTFSIDVVWTFAQMIDYCKSGTSSPNKRAFIESLYKRGNREVCDYIDSKSSREMLHTKRDLKEIESFKGRNSLPVYRVSFFGHTRKYPNIFDSMPKWTLAQMIDYCFCGRPLKKKSEFIDTLMREGDEATHDYIISKLVETSNRNVPKRSISSYNRPLNDLTLSINVISEITCIAGNALRKLEFLNKHSGHHVSVVPFALNLKNLIPFFYRTNLAYQAESLYYYYNHLNRGVPSLSRAGQHCMK